MITQTSSHKATPQGGFIFAKAKFMCYIYRTTYFNIERHLWGSCMDWNKRSEHSHLNRRQKHFLEWLSVVAVAVCAVIYFLK
jgi:hypothetical protein